MRNLIDDHFPLRAVKVRRKSLDLWFHGNYRETSDALSYSIDLRLNVANQLLESVAYTTKLWNVQRNGERLYREKVIERDKD